MAQKLIIIALSDLEKDWGSIPCTCMVAHYSGESDVLLWLTQTLAYTRCIDIHVGKILVYIK